VGREDWYRNTEWNDDISVEYFKKLSRARKKDQYLRIQANYLSDKYPEVALKLLDQFFAIDESFDTAQAFCDKAVSLVSLNRIDEAVASYKSALGYEKNDSCIQTQAYLKLPCLIVDYHLEQHFHAAVGVLEEHIDRPMFPLDHFLWFGCMAILKEGLGKNSEAAKYAGLALDAAKIKKSGFRYHQRLGIVGKKHKKIIKVLRAIYA